MRVASDAELPLQAVVDVGLDAGVDLDGDVDMAGLL
jgi:hypothetical protein